MTSTRIAGIAAMRVPLQGGLAYGAEVGNLAETNRSDWPRALAGQREAGGEGRVTPLQRFRLNPRGTPLKTAVDPDQLPGRLDRTESDLRAVTAALSAQERQLRSLKHGLGAFDALLGRERKIRALLDSRIRHLEKAAAGLLEYFNKLRAVVEIHNQKLAEKEVQTYGEVN